MCIIICLLYKHCKLLYKFSHDCKVILRTLLICKPLACRMLNSRCWHLNQNHKKLPSTPCLNDVTLVWVIFATFIFNCCSVIDSPTFYIGRIQVNIVSFFYSMSTHVGPPFLDLVLPFKWFDRKVQGMFQCLLVCLNDGFPLSIASMAF
jgi:hypothetical protein